MAINPPGPRYTIPKSTLVEYSPDRHPEQTRPYRTRQLLTFDTAYAHQGAGVLTFRHAGYLIHVERSRVVERADRIVHALQFELPGMNQLCVWPDRSGHAPYVEPLDATQTLLDIQAGDRIRHGTTVETVQQVKIYRSTPVVDVQTIPNGRAFLDGNAGC